MPCLLCVHAPVHALVRMEKAAPRQKESAEDPYNAVIRRHKK